MYKQILVAGIFGFGLSGCASFGQNKNVKGSWDCAAEKGFGWRNISDIRDMIARPGEGPAAVILGSTPDLSIAGVPAWRPDQIMQIFIADFIDEKGNYHKEHEIYTVVQHGGWALNSGED